MNTLDDEKIEQWLRKHARALDRYCKEHDLAQSERLALFIAYLSAGISRNATDREHLERGIEMASRGIADSARRLYEARHAKVQH